MSEQPQIEVSAEERARRIGVEVSGFWKAQAEFLVPTHERFYAKAESGRAGWNDPDLYDPMRIALRISAEKGNWVDVANFAMFLWNLDQLKKEAP